MQIQLTTRPWHRRHATPGLGALALLLPVLLMMTAASAGASQSRSWSGSGGNLQTTSGGSVTTIDLEAGQAASSGDSYFDIRGNDALAQPTTGIYQPPMAGETSLQLVYEPETNNAVKQLVLRFSNPVSDPVIHIDRLGGHSNYVTNSAAIELNVAASPGVTGLERLSGVNHFIVDNSGTRIRGSAGEEASDGEYNLFGFETDPAWSPECRTDSYYGAACGSVRINGTFTEVVFDVDMLGEPGDGDLFEFALTFNQDLGDAPASYGRALHPIAATANLMLGAAAPDDDPDGNEFSTDAQADDETGRDDEDGVSLPSFTVGEASDIVVTVDEATTGSSYLQGWIDWDGDGLFEAAEQVASNVVDNGAGDTDATAGTVTLSVTAPSDAATGVSYSRFRWSSTPDLGATSVAAADGEVEDASVFISSALDDSCKLLSVNTVGDASVLSNNEIQLTPDTTSQLGGAWGLSRVDLTQPFDYQARVFLGDKDEGADGMTFTLQNVGDTALGMPGRGIGAGDNEVDESGGLDPSLIVELDTYQNGDLGWNDPAEDHLAVYLDGNGRHEPGGFFSAPSDLIGPVTLGNIEDGAYHNFRVTWAPADQRLDVYLDGSLLGSVQRDLAADLGTSTPYWGYTASTGGATNAHRICNQSDPSDTSTSDYSDAPASYGDASHTVLTEIKLGAEIDKDAGSLASADADGDGADDDGIFIPALQQVKGATINAQVAGDGGYLQGWIDYDGDGLFNANEQVAINVQDNGPGDTNASTGVIGIPVSVPATATTAQTFARFRWSTESGVPSTGHAADGEVEDYAVTISPADTGTVNSCLMPIVGAATLTDVAWPGTPSTVSVTTNLAWAPTPDSDQLPLVHGEQREMGGNLNRWEVAGDMSLTLTFSTPVPAREILFRFNDVGHSATEAYDPIYTVTVNGSATLADFVMVPTVKDDFDLIYHPSSGTVRKDVLRADTRETGALVGEGNNLVSELTISSSGVSLLDLVSYNLAYIGDCDFGDAPDTGPGTSTDNYETLGVSDGPSHVLRPSPQYYLGSGVTAEPDGLEDISVSLDKDDGIVMAGEVFLGYSFEIVANVTGSEGYLQGWIDWNDDGDFTDPGDQVAAAVPDLDGDGKIVIPVTVPLDAVLGPTVARFRWSPSLAVGPTGYVIHGEVEDYPLIISALARLSGSVFADDGAGGGTAHDGLRNGGEGGIDGVTVQVRHDEDGDGRCSDTDSVLAETVTNGAGAWSVVLGPEHEGKAACLVEKTPSGYRSVSENAGGNALTVGAGDDDQMAFTVTAARDAWTGITFGDVRQPLLEADQLGVVVPGGARLYPHRYTAGTDGVVDFQLTGAVSSPATPTWEERLYRDADCNGQLDDGEASLATTGVAVTRADRVCLLVQVQSAADVPLDAQHSVELLATQSLADTSYSDAVSVKDGTRVEAGQLSLFKQVRNIGPDGVADTADDVDTTASEINQARPGDVLRYEIQFRNHGTRALAEVQVHDATPAFSALAGAATCPDSLPESLSGCSVNTPDGTNESGYQGGLRWDFSGRLLPGASGAVFYSVRVDE